MVVLLEGSPITTEERVLGHLPDQGPSSMIAQFGWPASRKSLGGSRLLPFQNDEATVFLGTFNAADIFLSVP